MWEYAMESLEKYKKETNKHNVLSKKFFQQQAKQTSDNCNGRMLGKYLVEMGNQNDKERNVPIHI